jgi:2,3-dihydroxyethylbenzene 1,2-dioxygenase
MDQHLQQCPETGVTQLGYVGMGVADLDAWREYATGVCGMEARDGGGDGFQLRLDTWHHRIDVRRDGSDDILYLGWRVRDQEALEGMAQRLEQAGVPYRRGSEDDCEERRVLGLLKLSDPAGIATEIFFSPEIENHRPFHPGRPLHGRFVTGDHGLGHCFLTQHDAAAAYAFYRLLGMRGGVEYKFDVPGGPQKRPVFMRCNRRQHTLSFGEGYRGPKRVNHLMFEYTSLDDLGMALDIVQSRNIPVVRRLGRHSNDGAVSFYFANPSGWVWELGWNGRDAPAEAEHYRGDYYGHQTDAQGFGL